MSVLRTTGLRQPAFGQDAVAVFTAFRRPVCVGRVARFAFRHAGPRWWLLFCSVDRLVSLRSRALCFALPINSSRGFTRVACALPASGSLWTLALSHVHAPLPNGQRHDPINKTKWNKILRGIGNIPNIPRLCIYQPTGQPVPVGVGNQPTFFSRFLFPPFFVFAVGAIAVVDLVGRLLRVRPFAPARLPEPTTASAVPHNG